MIISEWIKEHCFDIKGNLNSKVSNVSWWKNRNYENFLDDIKKETVFIDTDNITQRIYHIINGNVVPTCKVCGFAVLFRQFKSGYREYCSVSCATQSDERNSKIQLNRNYDNQNILAKKTNIERYGVEWTTQTDNMKSRTSVTKKIRYGDENYNNQEKSKKTCLEKYGVEYTGQVKSVIDKIQKTKDISIPQLRDSSWLIEQNKTKGIQQISEELNVSYRTVYLWFLKHNIEFNNFIANNSKPQLELYEYVKSLTEVEVIYNDRKKIYPKEIDVYIPEFNIGFELNGMFWHSEDRLRHIDKHNICDKLGISLVQIWDQEWYHKQDIVKSIIKSKLGLNEKIFARKCNVVNLEHYDYKNFLESNHIQGNVNSSIRVGLMYDSELVCVMGVGKSRYDKKSSHELLRFCNKLNFTVVGGFSKLVKHVLKNSDINTLQTFSDVRLFSSKSYKKCGFEFSHRTVPGYVYYKSNLIKTRIECQKHKLHKLLENFDQNLTEHENMNNHGWLKVWDCGQDVYYLKCK